ncbi:gamma-glutamyltranspeptidase [Thraustotheca clavata]|uniref:Gamma-glutamyltranspeptidase n=1 Tax=Thraustotheca clavata TaxID=74557 RepID=A0A1W0ACL3_9STRA|nr:gamma-glutamyltranspeptidase [Thraustotheca clavata]
MSLQDILQPAIDLAREGFPVTPVTSYLWERGVHQLTRWPHPEDLLIDGRAPRNGEIFQNPSLAASLESIALYGKAGFYEGPLAKAIVDAVKAQGGVLSLEDLKEHQSTFVTPIKANFRGVDVYEIPPNGQGIAALLALNFLEHLPNADQVLKSHNSVEYLHTLIEALRLAFADARWYVSDPEVEHIPVEELLSAKYAKERVANLNSEKAMVEPKRGSPVVGSNTVSFQVVDIYGNAVSMVNSNYAGFGSGCHFEMTHRYNSCPRSFTRSPVYGTHGMVATNQPLASEIGYNILKRGGNAVDAAIAIAAALNVTEPCSTGIGGDCFLLYYNADTRQVAGLNGSGRAPKELTLEKALKEFPNAKSIPLDSVHSITV